MKHPPALLSLGLLVTLGACGKADDGAVPRFDESSCPFKLHSSQVQGQSVRCGALVARLDRADASSPAIRVPVVIFLSKTPAGAPVIQLSGGPGQSWGDLGLENLALTSTTNLTRDLVFIEQRGTGLSSPALQCPEFDQPNATEAAALQQCQKRLSDAGQRPAAYHTRALAADVADLAAILRADRPSWRKIVLNGTSYGTLWGLSIIRDFPDLVDRAILDSVVTPEQPPFKNAASARDGATTALFAACAADSTCKARFPTLEKDLTDAVAALARREADKNPLTYKGQPFGAADFYDVLDGIEFAAPSLVPLLVNTVAQRVQGATLEPIDPRFESALSGSQAAIASLAIGQYFSVSCSDNQLVTREVLGADLATVRPALRPYAEADLAGLLDGCQAWPYQRYPASAFAPVKSAVPVLLLSGALDPRTPPAWAAAALPNLSNGTHIIFPGLSHSVQSAGDPTTSACLNTVLSQFIRTGAVADRSCVASTPVVFSQSRPGRPFPDPQSVVRSLSR